MNAIKKIAIQIIELIIAIFISLMWGKNISFEQQKAFASSLITIASIIFAVLGIWIGLIAPNSIRAIYDSKTEITEKKQELKELENLYKPVFFSLFVFASMSCFCFIGEILKNITFLLKYAFTFRQIGFAILIIFFLKTFILLFFSALPGIKILVFSYIHIQRNENIDSFFKKNK